MTRAQQMIRSFILIMAGFMLLLTIISCADSTYSEYRDGKTEELVGDFYKSSNDKVEIKSLSRNRVIDGFCVLVPYQQDLNDKDNLIVPANAFLREIRLQSQEDYWHIVVRSSNHFILLRFRQRYIPLETPARQLKNSCKAGSSLIVNKDGTRPNSHLFVNIGD